MDKQGKIAVREVYDAEYRADQLDGATEVWKYQVVVDGTTQTVGVRFESDKLREQYMIEFMDRYTAKALNHQLEARHHKEHGDQHTKLGRRRRISKATPTFDVYTDPKRVEHFFLKEDPVVYKVPEFTPYACGSADCTDFGCPICS